MKKYLTIILILSLLGFVKDEKNEFDRAKELGDTYLDFININGIKGGYFYIDSLNRTHTLRNFKQVKL